MAEVSAPTVPRAHLEPVQLCPECRTSNRRPVAPGRRLCQPHLDNKRENQKTRRQRAKMRYDAGQALHVPNNRVHQKADAPASIEDAASLSYAMNRPPHPPSPLAASAVIGPQQFQAYIHERAHESARAALVVPIEMPGLHMPHPGPNTSWGLGPEQDVSWPRHPTAHDPLWERSLGAAFQSLPLLEPTPMRDDSGYSTVAPWTLGPQNPALFTPGGNFIPPVKDVPAEPGSSILVAQDRSYPDCNLRRPAVCYRSDSMPPTTGGNRVDENTIPGYDFTIEAGNIMAVPEYPEFGAPIPHPDNILMLHMLTVSIGNSLEPPQVLHMDAVFTNSALNQSPPIVGETVPLDLFHQFGEGQDSSHFSILATEVVQDSAYQEGNRREPAGFYGSGSTLPTTGGNTFGEGLIPGYDFFMEEGHIMAVPGYPEFGAPIPPHTIITLYKLTVSAGYSLELPQGHQTGAILTNPAVNPPPPIREEADPFDLFGEGQGSSDISILGTELDWASFEAY